MVMIGIASACAPAVKKPPKEIVSIPVEAPEEKFVKEYLRRGMEYEDKGDLVGAFKQYKLAMTVNPKNQEALENRNRLEMELRSSAKEHYKTGLKFQKKGKYGLARRQFLIALRLWPDYPEVVKVLTSKKRFDMKKYIVHTIKPGESLSKVAMIYYGDYYKFPIIAKYNDISDATDIKVGQKIKVPEIEGIEFLAGNVSVKTAKVEITDSELKKLKKYTMEGKEEEKKPEAEVKEEEKKPLDEVAIYRDHGVDLFMKKKYQEAIFVFNKVLNIHPEDSIALEYSYKSHFQQGIALFDKKDYMVAKDQFEVCLQYRSDCQKCHRYIKESESLYKEMHYRKGMQFFENELLIEAIRQWKLVKIIDPNYKRVDYLINKANTILKKIEEIKKTR